MADRFLLQDEENSFGADSMEQLIEKNREELERAKEELKKVQEDIKNTEQKQRIEKQTASRMPQTQIPTDDASMDKVGMEASVNKKKPLYGKKIAELNVRVKELSERIKNLDELIKSQEDTLKDMGRETTTEHRIIKATDFKSIVKNFDKINLSESDIINILVQTQNPVMKKSELVESIQNKLIFEAEMNRDVRRSFEEGGNDYSDIIGSEVSRELANQSFQEIARAISQKTGKQNVTLDDVQQLMSNSLMSAAKEEYRYGIERLEQKAVEMIRKQFNIPEGAVEFEATITGVPQKALGLPSNAPQELIDQMSRQLGVKIGDIQREGLKYDRGNQPAPEGKSEEQLKPKIKRRRLTNSMMHGAARKSQNLHHMDDQLRQENPRLNRDYSNLMAANDASYWMMSDDTIKDQGRSGVHAGNVRVKLSNQPGGAPKIIAQGIVFPILLHELAKGVVELMSLWSLPADAEERKYVLDKTDNLDSETNDIRLGPVIWSKFVEQIPVDNQEVISLTFNMLQELSDSEFNSIIDGLLQNRTEAQTKVRRLAEEAMEELRREASDETFGLYGEPDEDDDVATPEAGGEGDGEYTDPELERILGGQKSEPTQPEIGDEDIALEDMSDSELKELMKIAIENEDYEYASEIRDILNKR